MVKYYYDKYSAYVGSYNDSSEWTIMNSSYRYSIGRNDPKMQASPSYSFDNSSNTYSYSGGKNSLFDLIVDGSGRLKPMPQTVYFPLRGWDESAMSPLPAPSEKGGAVKFEVTSALNDAWDGFAQGNLYEKKPSKNSVNYLRGNLVQTNIEAENGTLPNNARHSDGFWYVRKGLVNQVPTVTLNTTNNRTLYENDSLVIDGQATDLDVGNAVTVKYQIDSGTVRNLASSISDGTKPISFSKALSYKEGVLKDGSTVLTSLLNKDMPHTLSVWVEDDQGGKSTIQTRTFYVVPNRPPSLKVDPIAQQSNLINSNTIAISGVVSDPDNNDVTVSFKINDEEVQQVYSGPPSAFTFNIRLGDLRNGANTVTVEVTDIYEAKVSKVISINKTHNAVPLNKATAMYRINPPTGSASKILMWIERLLGDLSVSTEISMTNEGEPESFVPLVKSNSEPINTKIQEDEFAYQTDSPKSKIILKVNYSRNDVKSVQTIKKLSGVLS